MTLDDLLAREGIRDLVARYNSCGDSGKFDQLWPLFAHDAVMQIGLASGERTEHIGLEQIKQIFTGAQDTLRSHSVDRPAPVARRTYIRHFTSTHQIDLLDADHAMGRCHFAVIIGDDDQGGLDHWGRYLDEYVRIDETWRFQRRQVHVDGQIAQSWFSRTP